MSLTTARLDEMPSAHGLPVSDDEIDLLIAAARLQVAIDELPLPEGWAFDRLWVNGGGFEARACKLHFPAGPVICGRGPTMLAAVTALGDALRSRA